MLVVCSINAIDTKYPGQAGVDVRAAIAALGPIIDASGLSPEQIRDLVDQKDPTRKVPACLVGGYDILPSFRLSNPTRIAAREGDVDVMTDAPFGARADSAAERYLPTRAVARIPDSGVSDAPAFIAMLQGLTVAPTLATPPDTFELSAAEFAGSAGLVHVLMPGSSAVRLSPPHPHGMPSLNQLVSGTGRLHILLHGSDKHPGRATLWGRSTGSKNFVASGTATDLAGSQLKGSIVSFSSCYSAMLDAASGDTPRTPNDQVAMACLTSGAKVVYGSTRANWIDITTPFDSFGSALIAHVWRELRQGHPAAEALRLAKWEYSRIALAADAWTRPYVLKTLLQAQCYGHPLATL